MREIKYRAWKKEYKRMIRRIYEINFEKNEISYIGTDGDLIFVHFEDIVLMQYIGLRDRTGKEIYEGDIVEYRDEICFITYKPNHITYVVVDVECGNEYYIQSLDTKNLKVIGNIYEDEKLLEV